MKYAVLLVIGIFLGAFSVIAYVLATLGRFKNEKKELQAERERLDQLRRLLHENSEASRRESQKISAEREEFENKVITYAELENENQILKRDLQNIDVELRKLQLDREIQGERQEELDRRCREVAGRYLKENVDWIGRALTTSNFGVCKQRLEAVIERCRSIGHDVPADEEARLVADLKAEFEKAVRAAFEREEQSRIKAQIREEAKLQKEIERELTQLDRERAAIQAALDRALAEARDRHSDEVDRLRARLAEAEAKSERAKSMAQLTKSGHVYVISNIGSFGDGVFKIGMTRRLEPGERVKELGDASVPFPFDVHMMISSDDAPKLENALHRELHKLRINKINVRKEFFRTSLDTIRDIVERNHGQVQYVADAEALEYRQSISMTDEDAEFIEGVYDSLEDEDGAVGAE